MTLPTFSPVQVLIASALACALLLLVPLLGILAYAIVQHAVRRRARGRDGNGRG